MQPIEIPEPFWISAFGFFGCGDFANPDLNLILTGSPNLSFSILSSDVTYIICAVRGFEFECVPFLCFRDTPFTESSFLALVHNRIGNWFTVVLHNNCITKSTFNIHIDNEFKANRRWTIYFYDVINPMLK